ncbi:ArnT family glycosyltransferase [Rhodococcus oxybenzonivorans]|uniref:ArnT family glycosyltransferase n=1 Tax=Rhodococcus oxybenzonivorans TaxID=1990687 RepID=UPI000D6995CC|nr:glycosyltransferase family 39 protein [Rhodococcus oxybenzonivorans]
MRPTRWLFWGCTALYLGVGLYLTVGQGFVLGDALSRVSAARSVWFSRDPHLAAIGFVFTPLTALVQLPTVLLSHWWPDLTSWAVTGVLMSAPFMSGAVVQIYKIGADRGCPVWLIWTVTAVFALNPMIIFYGGNGMSEAPFLAMMCWATRRLIRWCTTDDIHDLLAAGFALGLAYLARYDALAAGLAVTVFVFAVTVLRRGWRNRFAQMRPALLDAVLVGLPTAMAFFVWATISWLITGQALQQFSSTYGNASILAQSGGGSTDTVYAVLFSAAESLVLGPALPLLVPIAAALAWRRRDLEVLAAVVVLASVLGFATYSYARGMTFPFLRFYLCALPLMAVLALQLVPAGDPLVERRRGPSGFVRARFAGAPTVPAALAAALVVLTPAVTGASMLSPTLSSQQYALRSVVFPSSTDTSDHRATERRILASFTTERELARYLDALALPEGSVLMDTVYGFAVYTATERPRTFVIPSDQDFTSVLNRPAEHGVQFLLAVPNSGRGESDAVNRRYPTLYETGADIATLELEVPNDGQDQPTWRLYRVL